MPVPAQQPGATQLSRARRTMKFLFGTWGAVARAAVVIGVFAFAVDYFDLTVEVFGVTFSGDETCKVEVAEPPKPYPLPPYPLPYPLPYPAPQYPVPPYPPYPVYPPQVNQHPGQDQVAPPA